ncbi:MULTISPECIES: hypothetical protein [unclassified Afipia]|uniref:hypothetical protein n=1 Tax=unclassified Afipia TaxID=2642050 RepID=UPI000467E5F5|nr:MULTISPECIES: hypothetical protein [unclassified Afipia]
MLRYLICIPAALFLGNAAAADPATLPARLDCSALTANPTKAKPFTSPITLSYTKGVLTGERALMSGDGVERFEGRIDPLGRIELNGSYADRRAWTYQLRGQLSDTKPTVLRGRLQVTTGTPGHRDCTLTFLEKPNSLMATFSAY